MARGESRGGGYDLAVEKERKRKEGLRTGTRDKQPPSRSFLGALMGPRTAPQQAEPSAPQKVGDLMTPSTAAQEPPPSSPEEFNQKVSRNSAFLKSPETQAMLMQFGMAMMQGADLGQAAGLAVGAPGRLAEKQREIDKEAREEERAQQQLEISQGHLDVSEGQLEIAERSQRFEELKWKYGLSDDEADNQLELEKFALERSKFALDVWKAYNPDAPPPTEFQKELSSFNDFALKGDRINAALTWARIQQLTQEFTGPTGERFKPPAMPPMPGLEAAPKAPPPTGNAGAPGATSTGVPPEVAAGITGTGVEPEVVPLPGSKATREAQEAERKLVGERMQMLDTSIIVTNAANDIVKKIDVSNAPDVLVAGYGGLLSYLPDTEAKDVAGLIATIKANVTFAQLQKIREASEHGGAVGQVSNMEDILLGSTLVSLDQMQTASQLRFNLTKIAFLYNPTLMAQREAISTKLVKGEIDLNQAKAAFDDQYRKYVLGPEADRRPTVTLSNPPAYIPNAAKELWPHMSAEDRRALLDEEDQYIFDIQQGKGY